MSWVTDNLQYVYLFIFVVGMIFVGVGMAYFPKDARAAAGSQIQVMGVVSFLAIMIFGYFSNSYIKQNPALGQDYLLLLVYTSLFASLMAISAATVNKTN